jgi:hypothetical protein
MSPDAMIAILLVCYGRGDRLPKCAQPRHPASSGRNHDRPAPARLVQKPQRNQCAVIERVSAIAWTVARARRRLRQF